MSSRKWSDWMWTEDNPLWGCEPLPETNGTNLRSAGCIIGEMMNSTPLFPDASEIQVAIFLVRDPHQEWSVLGKNVFSQSAFFFCFIILNWKGQPAVSLFHHFWQSWCHQTAGSAGLAKDPEPLLCLQPGRVWCSLGFNHYSKKNFHPSCWWFRLALQKHRNLIGGTEILGWVNFHKMQDVRSCSFCRMIYDDTIFLWLAWPFGDDILVLSVSDFLGDHNIYFGDQ